MAKRRQKKASPVKKRSFVRQTHNLAVSPIAECIRNACLPAASLFLALNPGAVFAGPEGGEVAGGQGNISTPNSTTTVINQQSQNLAIDWASFNVNVNELVQFKQPSKTASALNRIHDSNPSQIFGSITANGNVLLVNPNGVFFKPGASVNVNSLTASGLDISTSDFMNGKLNFNGIDGTNGLVVNQGVLQAATGGSINLVGKAVINEGVIIASAGQVNLVAGDQITIDFDGDGLMQFAVDREVLTNAQSLDAAVSNTGEIQADGGTVLLKGSAAKDIFSHVVNNEGIIKAGRIENKGGEIRLVGLGTGSSVLNTGTLNVSGTDGDGGTVQLQSADTTIVAGNSVIDASSSDANGGTVQILGDKVALLDTTTIKASGEIGGGEVLIGGDYKGSNPDIKNAQFTTIAENVKIKADAISEGDGGKVIVWSDDTTRMHGKISVRGGDISGNGGFVEVSGKKHLYIDSISQQVDVSALNGEGGTLLLDPNDINIIVAAAGGTVGGSPEDADTINDEDIENFLNGTGSLIIETNTGAGGGSGDILFANNVSIIWTTDNRNLTFNADRSITFGTGVTVNGTASLTSVLDFNFGIVTAGSFDISNSPALTAAASVTIDGTTAANDSIIGGSAYIVTGADLGTVDTIAFTNVGNLTGSTGADTFTLAGGTLSGSIAGGGGAGINTLTGDNVANTWTVTALDAGTLTGVTNGFSDIDNLIGGTDTDGFTLVGGTLSGSIAGGGGAGVNTQTGDDVANTGGVTGDDSGTLTGITSGYTDIDNLVGGSDTDAFNFTDGVVVTGSIDGNFGSDTLNLSAYTTPRTVVINATSTANGFAGTEASIANGFADIDVLSLPAAAGDSLQGADFANAWSITAGDAGSLTENANVLTFSGVNSLIGGTNTDGFTLAGGTLSGSIAGGGGGGVNTLTGDDVANTWGVTGNDSGTLTGITSGYTDIDNLAGGSDTDAFNFTDGVVVTGSIDGNVGSDTLNLSAYTTPRTVVINATSTANGFAGTEASIANGFADIDVLSLPAAAGDSLQGANFANVWSITAGDAGSLTENANVLTFSGVNSLIGGTNTDGFTLAGGTLSGSIAGGGGGGVNTLTGDDVANTWGVTGNDSGTLTGITSGYTDIDNLAGGSDTDAFNFTDGVVVTGSIDGNAGSDTLNLSAYTTARTVVINATSTANGFAGTEASIANGFADIDVLSLPAGAGDSLQGGELCQCLEHHRW